MNICLVTDTYLPRVNGVVQSIRSFAREFKRHGHRVFILAPRFPKYQDPEADIWRFPSHYLFFDPEDRLANTWLPSSQALIRRLGEAKIDLIHTQTPFSLGMAAIGWARRFQIPLVHTYHTLFEAYVHLYIRILTEKAGRSLAARFSRWFCNQHDLNVVPSSPIKETLQGYGVTRPIVVNPTGIDLSPFQNLEGPRMRKQLGFGEQDILLLTMGRVAREKNLPFLFDVLERLAPRHPQARLVISGQGPALEETKAECTRRGLQDKVVFLGYLNRKDWVDLYAAADLHLLASVTETQGLVLTEAMAAGTPCVAVAAMGVKDVMAGGGGLAVGLNVEEFAAAVHRLLTDQDLYAAKVAEAKIQAQAWSIEAKAVEMLGHYQDLIKAQGK